MKKGVYVLLGVLSLILLSSFAFAQLSDFSDEFSKATQCLDDEIRTTQSLTLEEAVFSVLAGSTHTNVLSTISNAKHSSEECWPSGGCTVKETAQVALAEQARGRNIDDILEWLETQTATPSDLIWYLQVTIENNREASCNINYDGSDHTITVNGDLTLSGNGGNCLTIDNKDFWLRIEPGCVEKEFNIGCDWDGENSGNEEFLSNLVYRQTPEGITFVSSSTESSQNGGIHPQKINAKCFTNGANCDYEGSLWATAAIHNDLGETKNYVPYLLGLADNNQQYFPESFLMYILGQGNNGDQFDAINSKVSSGHWDITGGYSQFVDTGLAMIALGGGEASTVSGYGTLDWLFTQATEEGCFNNNNIRDTAYIIYAAKWRGGRGTGSGNPLPPGGLPGGGGSCEDIGGTCGTNCSVGESETDASCTDSTQVCCTDPTTTGNTPNYLDDCELEGYFCGDRIGCLGGGGSEVDQYSCLSFAETCCTIPVRLDTCGSLGGAICGFDEECSNSEVQSDDGSCCVSGVCRPLDNVPDPTPTTTTSTDQPKKGVSVWVWIILLLVLIGFAVLAIIYKDKIRMWIFKRKGKVKTSEVKPGRASFGGPSLGRRPPPRFGPPPGAARGFGSAARRPVGRKDKEMDDTLRKLEEMSK